PGILSFDVSQNLGSDPRAGSITVAGLTMVVTQLGANGVHYGDLNGDNQVDISDLVLLANVIAGNVHLQNMEAADVEFDHSVNVSDLVALANELAGNIKYLPVVPVTEGPIADPGTDFSRLFAARPFEREPGLLPWLISTPFEPLRAKALEPKRTYIY